jgi:hypothetical protein
VQLRRVAFTYGGGDAALGEPGIAVVDAAFGYQENASLLLRQQGTVQPGNTTADYNVIITMNQATSRISSLILAGDARGYLLGFYLFAGDSVFGDPYRRPRFHLQDDAVLADAFNAAIYTAYGNNPVAWLQPFGKLLVLLLSFTLWSDDKKVEDAEKQYHEDNQIDGAGGGVSAFLGSTATHKCQTRSQQQYQG